VIEGGERKGDLIVQTVDLGEVWCSEERIKPGRLSMCSSDRKVPQQPWQGRDSFVNFVEFLSYHGTD
jgi:hypothetical protein